MVNHINIGLSLPPKASILHDADIVGDAFQFKGWELVPKEVITEVNNTSKM